MNLKTLNNIFLIFFSIFIGFFISEFVARKIGLGNPLLYKNDELIGYRLRANQSKKRFKNSKITIDYEGFRVDPNQINSKNAEIIVFVGDSVTYGGSYIDDSELFSSIYCKSNSGLICLNSGVNGWGTYNMGRFLSNFAIYSERIPHKFILVILPGDDLRNLNKISSLPYWTRSPKNPKAINELINFVLWKYRVPILMSNNIENKKEPIKESAIKRKTINQAWADLDRYIESSKSKVDVILTPPRYWFEQSKKFNSEIEMYDNYLSMLLSNPNVSKTCNLYYLNKKLYSYNDYVDSVHLSKDGHKKWANHIKSCLKEK
ncbi:SGNH/GDSL hydrolase family protein [Prochlorococcus marinus XMU1410]|uniref:SGNH/GDSL hydrolase family protein n=1 Tax=Prochlorococcus marinus TaxID=1219 RepID=UPI001AD9E718|nr:SGNH/GDSL hydrolase family protein [Prochlorococcus marinus]MBO8242379.1 SGNH/GDSL hydrolase family protein [Prochlorococcus marinus XMU1410]MBW3053527.1 hypothetical protein [Prochlorococcus marinus str. MU1410]